MSTPKTITYKGQQYQLVEALTEDELSNHSRVLHDLAQMLRPSIPTSDVAQGLDEVRNALTQMVRSSRLLIEEEQVLPKGVPGNLDRIITLASNGADSLATLGDRLDKLANRLGMWALKIDEHLRDKESMRELSPETQVTTPEKSTQFSHLF